MRLFAPHFIFSKIRYRNETSRKEPDWRLNAVVKVAVTKEDYFDKVETILKDYRKQEKYTRF